MSIIISQHFQIKGSKAQNNGKKTQKVKCEINPITNGPHVHIMLLGFKTELIIKGLSRPKEPAKLNGLKDPQAS